MEYLEEAYPATPRLLPLSLEGRAAVRDMCHAVVSGIQPLQNSHVLQTVQKITGKAGEGKAWAQIFIMDGFEGLEDLLKRYAGQYCFGDTLTLADCCVVPQVYNARHKYHVDMTKFPMISRVATLAEQHPSFLASRPEMQQDAPSKVK